VRVYSAALTYPALTYPALTYPALPNSAGDFFKATAGDFKSPLAIYNHRWQFHVSAGSPG
jgi:hypothetical protein